ncbi:MAG TPA: alpha/beta hydrolase, partial [Rhodocyclaceae bacterium]
MPHLVRIAALTAGLTLLAGCTVFGPTPHIADTSAIDSGRLPEPDLSLDIPGLGPCTDSPDRRVQLNASHPVTVMVHGCFGSAGRFRALSDVLAFHGQQNVCFSYDDRDSLEKSSAELARALERLASSMPRSAINVIGHSQGGLVSRRALISERDDALTTDSPIRLVTVSAPFSGIRAARFCAYTWLRVASLGLQDLACRAVSGDKWYEITYASDLINQPGELLPVVNDHLKIVTDERDSCRRRSAAGACLEDDHVFELAEQYQSAVDADRRVANVEIRAGHVEIVGNA